MTVLKQIIQLSISAAIMLVFGYALRSNGIPAWIMLFSTGIIGVLIFLREIKHFKSLNFFIGVFSGLSFYLFFYYVYARGLSFTNALFVFSFVGIFCFAWKVFENRNTSEAMPLLAPFFVTWAFVANWEFPSTFSPFLLYGHVEIFKVFFPLLIAAIVILSEKKEIVLDFYFFLGFLVASLSGMFEKTGLQAFDRYEHLAILVLFSIFSIIFFLSLTGRQKEKNNMIFIIFGVMLIPALITAFSFLQSYFGVFLPLPFDKRGLTGALMLFLLSGMILFLLFFKDAEADVKSSKSRHIALIPLLLIFHLLLFIPFEKNTFIYDGYRKSFFSSGWQFMGPYLFLWLTILFLRLRMRKNQLFVFSYTTLSALSIYYLWNVRLFHFFSNVPHEVFKELGSPYASWLRVPVFDSFNLIFVFLVSSVLLFEFFLIMIRRESGESNAI